MSEQSGGRWRRNPNGAVIALTFMALAGCGRFGCSDAAPAAPSDGGAWLHGGDPPDAAARAAAWMNDESAPLGIPGTWATEIEWLGPFLLQKPVESLEESWSADGEGFVHTVSALYSNRNREADYAQVREAATRLSWTTSLQENGKLDAVGSGGSVSLADQSALRATLLSASKKAAAEGGLASATAFAESVALLGPVRGLLGQPGVRFDIARCRRSRATAANEYFRVAIAAGEVDHARAWLRERGFVGDGPLLELGVLSAEIGASDASAPGGGASNAGTFVTIRSKAKK